MPGYKKGGYKKKYIIQKTNGKAIDPDAFYIVLRIDKDPHAREALWAYAESVKKGNKSLSFDFRSIVLDFNENRTTKEVRARLQNGQKARCEVGNHEKR